jgi:starch-binding outer membrane protein SusE/F
MKTILYQLCFLLCVSATFWACTTDDMELNKGMNTLALSASKTEATLVLAEADETALKFTWTTGNNGGTGSSISYVFEIAKKGTGFATKHSESLGKQVNARAFTEQELSKVLVNELGCAPGVAVELEARVVANVANADVAAQQAVVAFKATPFLPVTETLYLIGDATPNGWAAGSATPMKAVANTTGSFTWTGTLQKGSLKFITTLGSFLPSYNKKGATDSLIYRSSDSDPDVQFAIAKAGKYTITVNLIASIAKIEISDPPYSTIYFVGSFNNWSFTPMTQDPINNFIFRYGVVLNWVADGEFKFGTTSGSWDNMYHPDVAKAAYTHTGVTMDATGDNKWTMLQSECGVAYKMSLDITPNAEKFVMTQFSPYTGISLIGDATSAGWTIGNALSMTQGSDAYTYTWTGSLTAGALKFTCDKKSDWMGAWFMASESDKEFTAVTNEVITFVDKSISGNGDIDRKWQVKTAGNYTITLNQLTEKMTVVKNY